MTRPYRHFLRHRLGLAGAALAALLLIVALGAPWLAREDPLDMHMSESLRPPSAQHWFGTDQFGRDIWARVVYGARLSFTVGLVSMVLATIVGMPLGAAAGYLGGAIDAVAMRLMDAILAFPAILLAIGLVAALGPGRGSGIIAIGIVYIPVLARVTRGAVLARRAEEYVDAARAVGETDWGILRRHVLPNSIAPVLVQATVGFASAVVIEAAVVPGGRHPAADPQLGQHAERGAPVHGGGAARRGLPRRRDLAGGAGVQSTG